MHVLVFGDTSRHRGAVLWKAVSAEKRELSRDFFVDRHQKGHQRSAVHRLSIVASVRVEVDKLRVEAAVVLAAECIGGEVYAAVLLYYGFVVVSEVAGDGLGRAIFLDRKVAFASIRVSHLSITRAKDHSECLVRSMRAGKDESERKLDIGVAHAYSCLLGNWRGKVDCSAGRDRVQDGSGNGLFPNLLERGQFQVGLYVSNGFTVRFMSRVKLPYSRSSKVICLTCLALGARQVIGRRMSGAIKAVANASSMLTFRAPF